MSNCFPDQNESISSTQQYIQIQRPSINKSKVATVSILSQKFSLDISKCRKMMKGAYSQEKILLILHKKTINEAMPNFVGN